jgi:hypothetical protein
MQAALISVCTTSSTSHHPEFTGSQQQTPQAISPYHLDAPSYILYILDHQRDGTADRPADDLEHILETQLVDGLSIHFEDDLADLQLP